MNGMIINMKATLRIFLICLLFSVSRFKAYSFNSYSALKHAVPHIRVYPVTPQGKASTDYKLTVNGIPVPIERIEKFSGAPVQYALMDFDGLVKLNFEMKSKV
jgi:hypothetical protein